MLGSPSGIGVENGKAVATVAEGSGGTTPQTLSSSVRVNDGNWHYEALVYTYNSSNPSASTFSLYVDGVLASSAVELAAPYFSATQGAAIGEAVFGGTTYWFTGQIEDVAGYQTALSAARIAAHYAARGVAVLSPMGNPVAADANSQLEGCGCGPGAVRAVAGPGG